MNAVAAFPSPPPPPFREPNSVRMNALKRGIIKIRKKVKKSGGGKL